jgi:hypothetical protein
MKQYLKNLLIAGLFFMSLGGWMLHSGIHPYAKHAYGWVPYISGLLSIIVIPMLFIWKKTLPWGYVLNGMTVIIGTITMSHFALVKAPIWAEMGLLWAKFIMGRAIFVLEVYHVEEEAKQPAFLQWIRYPNTGFFFVHLLSLSAVYALGHLLWR